MPPSSRTASASAGLGVAALSCFVIGPLAIQLELVSAFVGFRVFGLALPLGLLALLLGAVGLWRTRNAAGRDGRGRAAIGFALGALLPGVFVVLVGPAASLPAINDITTDLEDPPAFVAVADLDANRDRDLAYPGEEFAAQQKKGYPDLGPILLSVAPVPAYAAVRATVEDLGWQIVGDDPAGGILEASDVTRVFRFTDDIVIRVRSDAGGARIDVRSKSRDGRGDLGANAARIRAFEDRLRQSVN